MRKCKYYSNVIQNKGDIYVVDDFRFLSLKAAIEHIQCGTYKVDTDNNGNLISLIPGNKSVVIKVYNDNPKPIKFENNIICTIRESKDIMCKYASLREIYVSLDGTEIYFEYFCLPSNYDSTFSENYLYDYSILYSDTRPDEGIYMCNFFGNENKIGFSTPFIARRYFDRDDPDNKFESYHHNDITVAYWCFPFILNNKEATIGVDYGIPWYSVPISTFTNKIGNIIENES